MKTLLILLLTACPVLAAQNNVVVLKPANDRQYKEIMDTFKRADTIANIHLACIRRYGKANVANMDQINACESGLYGALLND